METVELIRSRRSVGKVTEQEVPRELVEELLDAAQWAPNHHLNAPWKFIVLRGEGLEILADAMESMAARKLSALDPDRAAEKIAAARAKAFRAPVVIVVAVDAPKDDSVVALENIEAGAAAVQNILLAAHSVGLGAMWRTGDLAYDPETKERLGLDSDDHIVGFVYLGYPLVQPNPKPRSSDGKITWTGWE